ncbi:DUF7007 domain-containing protein [Acutalibacter muris]|uniref:DUF7007 domain-containing protein n=1 Tax=Acutalibacter muris TaxID=1796620 RepID=UPI00272956AC|nr:SNF2-related protein [Acutalibacter muris]
MQYSHRKLDTSDIPYFEDVSEKRELLLKTDALKNRQPEVAEYYAAHSSPDERVMFVKSLFNNTYTEILLDNGQRAGYRAYDDVLLLWRGAYLSREQEEYLAWEDVASAIEGLMQDGLWAEPMEQLTLQVDVPEEPAQDEGYIPNLFDLAGSTIPLISEPVESSVPIRPKVSQEVIDAALTLGANDPESRLRIIAEFMKGKPLAENAEFLEKHYGENGAGFYVGERKYSLWYDEFGLLIAPGESAQGLTAAAITWEQAAERIRELLDDGRYAGQAMLYRAWPFEKNRVAEALEYLHRDIDEDYKDKYLPTLTAALSGSFGYPDVVDKTRELLEQSEQLQKVIAEYRDFVKDHAHNRRILRFHYHRPDEILQGLQDLQRTPLKFTASPDFAPVERFFISQDEIDALLRGESKRNDYRIGVYIFFEQHPDRKERENYLSHIHSGHSSYIIGNDNVNYSQKELTFTHGDILEPYAAVKLKWSHVRKRIEELIKKDAFLSREDREIMESRTLEPEAESTSPLDRAKELIDEFCQNEYGGNADFSDLSRVEIGYTETEDGQHPIRFFADLMKYRLEYEVDGQSVFSLQCHDLDDLNEYLGNLEFDEMAGIAEEQYKAQAVDAEQNLTPDVDGYQKLKAQFPGMLVGVQVGNTMLFYGEDARKAAPALGTKIVEREIPGLGNVEVTGSSHAWQAVLKKLLEYGLDVTLARPEESGERYEVILSRTAAEFIPIGMEVEADGRRAKIESVDFGENIVRLKLLDTNYTHLSEPIPYVRELVEEANDRNIERDMAAMLDEFTAQNGPEPVNELPQEPTEPQPEQVPTVWELYDHYKSVLLPKLMEDEAYRNACQNADRQNAVDEGRNAVERAAKDLGIAQGDMQFYQLYYDNTPFHNRLKEELASEGYDVYMALSAELPPWGVEIGNHSPWGIVQTTQELADGTFKVSTPSHGGIMIREPLAKEYLSAELLSRGGNDNGWCFFEEDELAPLVEMELERNRIQQEHPEKAADTSAPIHGPLTPAYQVGDTVYLDDTAFTITNIGLFDIQLQDPTLAYPVFRSESKETFEKLLRRDERNLPITDYLPISEISAADNGGDLRDVLTSEGGLLNEQSKIEVSGWLRDGVGNDEIARRLGEKFDRTVETMALETGDQVDYSIFSDRITLDIQGKSRAVRMYDLRTVAGELRAMYQQELGGFHHEIPQKGPWRGPAQENPVLRTERKEAFEHILKKDEPNSQGTGYLYGDLASENSDYLEVLASEHGFFSKEEKELISSWLTAGEPNSVLAQKMQEHFSDRSDSINLANYRADHYSSYDRGLLIDFWDSEENPQGRMTVSWEEIARTVRAMYRQQAYGFLHEMPAKEPPAEALTPEPAPQDTAQHSSPQFTTKPVAIYRAEKNKLPFDVIIETIHVEEPQRGPVPQNFHISDDNLGAGGAKAKYQMNMAAIRTLHDIETENRAATPDEQETLSKYVGWGALADAFDESKPSWASEYKELLETLTPEEYESARASTLNAHYTSPTVIKAIYQALENMGFKGGNILEPSCGVGNFFGLLPESMSESKLYGVELDGLTGRIAKQLYPKAHIEIQGYESTSFQNNSFDIAIGNVPFGQYKVFDPAYNKLGFSIHNYFFAKTIDKVRPGGIIAFVTSRYTMDSKSTQAREYMAQRAELLGAIRLPNNAFLANAGTGVVTDILFLQKRERPIVDLPDWVYTEKNKDGFTINSYFVDHPEMILGEQSSDSTQYAGQEFTVNPLPGADLGELLAEAITNIDGQYMEAEIVQVDEEKEQVTIPADPDVKNFTYTIVKGDVYYRQDSVMVKMELGATAKARTIALMDLRDCTQRLIKKQSYIDSTETEVHHYQAELNRLYDNFAKRFGRINDKINERAFSQDSSYYLLCALEILDDDGKFDRKSDMFTKRTIYPHQEITHVATATEALAVSLGERARVDIPFMSELTGKTEEEVISELQGQIYRVPLKEPHIYQIADEYLSGNVREKLKVAEAAATADTIYNINVSALAAVQPKDLDASEIAVRLGTDWIDQKYIEQFMLEVLKTPAYAREYVHVQYSPIIHAWNISNKTHIRKDDVAAHSTYGTTRVSAYKLLEDALNLQNTKVFDTKEDAEGNEKRVLNAKETTLAQQKQTMLKLEFQDWIWRDPDRRQTLVRKYNDEMNCIRPRQYDGSHLVLAGMNPEIQLEEHQKNAIARAVYGGNTLLAHCVGAGKTFEITASAMEMKRLGLCSKSMIVVPNHLTQQWASEFLRLYPNANILVTTKRDFEKDRRKKFCSRIATGDYDAVIIGYSQFEKIPVSKVRQIRLLRDQIADISKGIEQIKMENGERFSKKQLERTKKSLKVRLEKLQADHRKDTVINFEELGIDRLFVDESDSFKNLFLVTKMQNVAGLSTSDAQKSSDMFNKTRYLDEITGYKGVIFATGTPISNSITEMFTVQRYLQYDALEAMHMEHFDSWASRFGETVTTMELAPEGTGYRPRERFAKFFNLPELMNIFHEVADIKTEDMLDLPTPEVEFHNIVAKPTEFQKAYVQKLSERATAVRVGNVDPTEDNMLKITNDGRKLGLDQRLISPLAEDEPDSKINICVENIMKYWEDGKEEKLTQLVFSDLSTPKKDGTFNVYDDIKQKLMERGVPENEVAFIHDAESEVKKKELFSKVRSGKVRVLIGSTQKLGAGTNIQDRLIALHHLDVPWRPRDLTQREGRIKRRGNQNDVVHVFRYVTEGTFDAYLYQTVEKKQQFIGQIMTSKSPARTCDDVDEAALSYAEVKALCAGDPRIKERMELDVDVARLQVMQASHRSQQYNLEDKLRKYFPQEKQRLEWRIEGIQKDLATLAEHPLPSDGYIGIELLGQRFDERKAAGVVLLNECKKVQVYTTVPVGEYRGLKLFVKKQTMYSEVQIVLKGALEYTLDASDSDIGNIIRIDKVPEHLPEELSKAQASLENVMQQIESAEQEVGKPFPQEQELKDKLARITELDVELKMDAESPSAMPREEISSCNCNEPVAL